MNKFTLKLTKKEHSQRRMILNNFIKRKYKIKWIKLPCVYYSGRIYKRI